MTVSTYERDNRLNVFRGTAYVETVNYYVSLHSADPGLTGASELSGNGYARTVVAAAAGSWAAPATNGAVRQITNAAAITFGPATGANWLSATHVGIWSALTAGNFIRGSALAVAKTVQVSDTLTFAIGDLVINET